MVSFIFHEHMNDIRIFFFEGNLKHISRLCTERDWI
jgi:hypothetical protein